MKPILGFDTETTGVGSLDKVLQIAAIRVDPVSFETIESFVTLIDPEREINPGAAKVHGITAEMVAGQPTIDEMWKTSPFSQWLAESDVIFGHNLTFDIRMLKAENFEGKLVLDTLPLVRFKYPSWAKHKLQFCVSTLDLPQRAAHDALGDIESTADILRHFAHNQEMGKMTLTDMLNFNKSAPADFKNKILQRFGKVT